MVALLLHTCRNSLIDEEMLSTAVKNRKCGVKITKFLLSKATDLSLIITDDILESAAENKRIGFPLLQEIFKMVPSPKVHESVVEAAAKNEYCPVEVMEILLEQDKTIEFTPRAMEIAATNKQYAREVLGYMLTRCKSLKVPPAVIEAAAGNEKTGAEAMDYLWKIKRFVVSPKALKAAAGNALCGENIISRWYSSKSLNVTSEAVETALLNPLGVAILGIFLRRDKNLVFTPDAIRNAAQNGIAGLLLLRIISKQQGEILVTNQILIAATLNSDLGVEIINFLLENNTFAVSAEDIEAILAMRDYEIDALRVLLDSVSPNLVTEDGVFFGSCYSWTMNDFLKVMLGKNPHVELSDVCWQVIVYNTRGPFELLETFLLIESFGKKVSVNADSK
jgi:hypothetical protein